MMDPIASEFRRARRQVERVNRRIAMADLPGKVIPGSQDMATRTLRLDLGRSADGRVIKGPRVRWQQTAGRLAIHTPPKDNEQLRLRSPSGTVGTGSQADFATFDADTAAPSQSRDEAVLEFGEKARITLREDRLELSIGGATIALSEDAIETLVGGTGHRLTAKELAMTTKFRAKGGSRPAHYVGGKDDDGDTAVEGNSEILI